jgi:uncharacterized protein (DUF58 family)
MALIFGLWREDIQVVALGIVMATFLLVAYARRTPRVRMVRAPSHLRVLEGDLYDMGFKVGAAGGWADAVELHDTIPGYMRLEKGSNHVILPIYKGEMRRASYSLDCPVRGSFRIGPLDLRASDAHGFFDQARTLEEVHDLDVVPLYVELRTLDLESRALKYNMGPVTINELGRSTDFYSIREYIQGDPYKKINWKASAKYRKLMINEDEKETLSDCAIFVDSRSLVSTGTALDNFLEASLRATLGLARTLVARKNRVMVVTYNDSVNIVPPGLGNAHNRIVQAMLVESVSRGDLTFDWAAGYARPFIKPRSDVIVFSPLVSDMTFYPTALSLIRSGHRVVVVTAPLEEYEERATGSLGKRALLMGLQRSTNIAELEAAGVVVIEVDPDEPQLSVMVRVSASLGGERLDVAALEGEDAAELPEPDVAPKRRGLASGLFDRELQEEAIGLKLAVPRLLFLQLMALGALVGASLMAWHLGQQFWTGLNDLQWGMVIDSSSYAILVGMGLFAGWAINMLVGFLKYVKGQGQAGWLVFVAYLLIVLLILWHIGSLMINFFAAGGLQTLVRDIILLPVILGSLAIFRRSTVLAGVAVAILMATSLAYANPMEDAWGALVMAILVMAFLEMAWGVERFDDLLRLASLDARRPWEAHPLKETMDRYLLIFAVSIGVAALISAILTFLPGWYVTDPVQGLMDPLDADTILAPVHLLFWLVVVTMVGRWTLISILESDWGMEVVEKLRGRLVLPGAKRGGQEEEDGADRPSLWEEELPVPDVVVTDV